MGFLEEKWETNKLVFAIVDMHHVSAIFQRRWGWFNDQSWWLTSRILKKKHHIGPYLNIVWPKVGIAQEDGPCLDADKMSIFTIKVAKITNHATYYYQRSDTISLHIKVCNTNAAGIKRSCVWFIKSFPDPESEHDLSLCSTLFTKPFTAADAADLIWPWESISPGEIDRSFVWRHW